jgi:hypothetical protein
MTTTADLAADLGVDEGDVNMLLNQLGESERELPDDLAGFVQRVFGWHGERTGGPLRCRQLPHSRSPRESGERRRSVTAVRERISRATCWR